MHPLLFTNVQTRCYIREKLEIFTQNAVNVKFCCIVAKRSLLNVVLNTDSGQKNYNLPDVLFRKFFLC